MDKELVMETVDAQLDQTDQRKRFRKWIEFVYQDVCTRSAHSLPPTIGAVLTVGVTILVIGGLTSVDMGVRDHNVMGPEVVIRNKRGTRKVSATAHYDQGAVVSDYEECSKIGRDIMQIENGSAVDAAVATVFCIGVVGPQASGLGGDSFWVIHELKNGIKQTWSINGRGRAPAMAPAMASIRNTFPDQQSKRKGPLAVTVMGEMCALYKAWSEFGRVEWNQLLRPSIKLCEEGFRVSKVLAERIHISITYNRITPESFLWELVTHNNGTLYVEGDIMKRPLLARTLQTISDNPTSLYSGDLADDILADLAGGILSRQDLRHYTCELESPLHITLANQALDMYVPTLPSGGPLMQYMLRILEGFDFPNVSLHELRSSVDFHHKVLETFKFGAAMRSYLGDPSNAPTRKAMKNITSGDFINMIRSKIHTNQTKPRRYYGGGYPSQADSGTAHVSVVSPEGAAVSVTTSINSYFGSKIYGERTGILFNNAMRDFTNDISDRSKQGNIMGPNKYPLSSMSPCIVLDHDTNNLRLVTGAAGGPQIPTQLAMVLYMNVLLGKHLHGVIDFPRFDYNATADTVMYESNVNQGVLDRLRNMAHSVKYDIQFRSAFSSIERLDEPPVYRAVGDWRRDSQPSGWNNVQINSSSQHYSNIYIIVLMLFVREIIVQFEYLV